MDSASVRNDIKILLLIVNSFAGLFAGLVLMSIGLTNTLSWWASDMWLPGIPIVVGQIVLGIGSLGYYAAIAGNKTCLIIYSVFMGMMVIPDLIMYLIMDPSKFGQRRGSWEQWAHLMLIVHAGMAVMAVILAASLAAKTKKRNTHDFALRPINPPNPYNPGTK